MNYGDALDYLLFQHDEYTMKPILDEQGRKQLRDEYYIDGINCEPMFFEKECEMVNKKYHKNYRYDEIKSHHYVLSFDPLDKTEHGLTGEKAQQLGLEFARKNFPGHQILVVTHTDGHNHSGNIHVHIVLNSVRKETVAEEDFMERPCDHKAGYKHHQTRALLTHLQKSLMELCEREKLNQIDLLSHSASKITQEEYWAQRRGQKNLDEINKQIIEDGYMPTQTKFQTQKQKIREAVDEIAAVSKSFEEFQSQLFEKYKITVIEKRGRYSYHLPEGEKNISERSLGTHYGKEYLSSIYGTKRKSISQETSPMREYDTIYDYQADPIAILYIRSNLRLVTDLQTCVKAQQSQAYAHKVKLTNLKQMAKTIVYIQEHGYDTRDDLQNQYKEILSKAVCLLIIDSFSNKIYLLFLFRCVIMTLLDECVLLLSQMKGVLIVISDTQNAQSPTKEKKTYTVEEIAEQLDISKKVAYSLVKSGQFSYVRAGKAIRVSKVSFDKWLNGI